MNNISSINGHHCNRIKHLYFMYSYTSGQVSLFLSMNKNYSCHIPLRDTGFTWLCKSFAKTLLTLTILPAVWARVVIIEINTIHVLTGKLVCFTFSALHFCWTRNLFTLCIPRWIEMCWSLPCLQKGILLLCYLLQFKLTVVSY